MSNRLELVCHRWARQIHIRDFVLFEIFISVAVGVFPSKKSLKYFHEIFLVFIFNSKNSSVLVSDRPTPTRFCFSQCEQLFSFLFSAEDFKDFHNFQVTIISFVLFSVSSRESKDECLKLIINFSTKSRILRLETSTHGICESSQGDLRNCSAWWNEL